MDRFATAISYLVAGASELSPEAKAEALRAAADQLAKRKEQGIPPHGAFYRLGDAWVLSWEGRIATVSHKAGMDIIRFLLDHPGQQYSAPDLDRLASGSVVIISPASAQSQGGERDELVEQRRQLVAWRDSLAEGHEQLPEIQKAIAEINRRLRGSRGDEYEASRKRVAANVSNAIRKIRRHLPGMAQALQDNLSIGTTCEAQRDFCARNASVAQRG